MPSFNSVAVIGAGAWGTALAGVAARAGRDVMLYARDAAAAKHMAATRENPRLPGVNLDARITVTSDIASAARADMLALLGVLVLFLAADKCFVHFDGLALATKRLRGLQIAHPVTNTHRHEPCRAIGAKAKHPPELMRGNAFLARRHQVRC